MNQLATVYEVLIDCISGFPSRQIIGCSFADGRIILATPIEWYANRIHTRGRTVTRRPVSIIEILEKTTHRTFLPIESLSNQVLIFV